jgi:hypothetical protein
VEHLQLVALSVSRWKRVRDRRLDDAPAGVTLHVVDRLLVLRLDHALLSENLQSLFVAVAALPAEVHHADGAAPEREQDPDGVVVADSGDFRDVGRRRRRDSRRVFPHDVQRHVDVVDGAVVEDAPGSPQVVEGGQGGVAAADLHGQHFADLAAAHPIPDGGERRVETSGNPDRRYKLSAAAEEVKSQQLIHLASIFQTEQMVPRRKASNINTDLLARSRD